MSGAKQRVGFYFDYSSPFSYLGATQIERVARDAGADVELRPILLGGLFKAIGAPDVPLLAMSEPRRRYQIRDLALWAEHWGAPFRWPGRFPMNTVTALRATLAAEREPYVLPLVHALYRAYWVDDRDLADPTTVGRAIEEVGGDAERLLAATRTPELKQRLRDATLAAERHGVFGVPTFAVIGDDGNEALYFGQDRLDFVARALQRKNGQM